MRTAELSKANAELQHEIEERKRVERDRVVALERERDANRLKDEFLATLSHELRTPMNAVLGWARVLRSTAADEPTRERGLESIERNARAQARLIEDLLEISRIVTGKLRLQVREVDLAAIVDTAVDIVGRRPWPSACGSTPTSTSPGPDAGRSRSPAAGDLEPALERGQVHPAGRPGQCPAGAEERVVLTVQDSGSGIDPKFLPHVFDAFRQADGSATREHGGLGLGLAIARQLVEAHGGTIEARSAGKDRGAVFEVFLPSVIERRISPCGRPRTLAESRWIRHCSRRGRAGRGRRRRCATAAADDADRLWRGRHDGGLGGEALAAIERSVPHVVLSDIGMPHEDGYDLLRRLRARSPENGGAIPAIAVTAYASAADRSSTQAAGYQAHVAKPFEPGDVARLVRRLVSSNNFQVTSHEVSGQGFTRTCHLSLVSCKFPTWRRRAPLTSPRTSICRKWTTR